MMGTELHASAPKSPSTDAARARPRHEARVLRGGVATLGAVALLIGAGAAFADTGLVGGLVGGLPGAASGRGVEPPPAYEPALEPTASWDEELAGINSVELSESSWDIPGQIVVDARDDLDDSALL